MVATTITLAWRPEQRREEYVRLFEALCDAQKRICLNECNIVNHEHCLGCQEADMALMHAATVIEDWSSDE